MIMLRGLVPWLGVKSVGRYLGINGKHRSDLLLGVKQNKAVCYR